MKLGAVTKFDNRKTTTSKKFDDDFVLVDFNVIVIFAIYDHFAPIRKPDSGRMVCKSYIFIDSNLLSYKN